MTTPFFTGWLAQGVGSGSTFVENVTASYVRQPAVLTPLVSGETSLQAGVTFAAPGSAIKITQRGLYDAATGGNLILFWDLYAPVALLSNQTDTISAGSLSLAFPSLVGVATTTEVLWLAGTAVGSTSEGAPLLTGTVDAVLNGVLAAIGSSGASGSTGSGLPPATAGNTVATPPSSALSVLLNGTVVEYISLPHLATALGVTSTGGGGSLPTPSSGNTITTPGSTVVPLVTATGVVEYITPSNFASAVSISGGATLPTPSSSNTITSPGTTVVPLVTGTGTVEYITTTNLASAIGVSGAGGLPAPSAANTVTNPGSLVVPLVTGTGTVEFITPANIASALGLGGAAGLPVPGASNIVTTIGTTATLPFIAAGGTTVEYITPLNLIDAIGTFPTVATTGTVHSSDLILLYQGGTIAQLGSVGGLFAAFEAYQQSNLPQLTLTTPGTVAAGSVFEVSGTISNYITTPLLTVSIDSGSYGPLGAGSSVSLSAMPNINLVIGSLAVGPHTIQIKDSSGVYSNAISVTASTLPAIVVSAPIGVQPGATYQAVVTLQNYGTAPTLDYSVDGGAYSAVPSGSTVGTSTATIANLPALAAGTHTIEIEDTTNAVFSNTAAFTVANEILTLSNPGSQYAGTAFNLAGSFAHGAPTGFDWSISGGATWTTATSPTVTGSGSGTFAFPVTIGAANPSETIEVRDHNLPSIISNTQSFAVAPAPTPATISAGGTISTSGSLVTLLFSEPVTLPNPSGLTLFANGGADPITWPNAAVPSNSQTGTLALPITSGETVTYSTTNIGFTFPNLAALSTGATIANNSTLAASLSVVTPVGWFQNASQILSGGYVGPAPTGFNVKFDAGTYTALANPTIGGGAWSGTITSPAAGSHSLTVQELPNTSITAATGTFSVSSGFSLLFTGAAGNPTGNQVLTPFSGSASTYQLDGNGNLELLATTYQYAAFEALGVQADGTLTAYIAAGYQGSFALLFRINAALTQYYALIYTGTSVQLYYSGSGGAGFANGFYMTPTTLSTLAVQYSGTSITVFANGTSLGGWTDSTVTAAGFVGIGAVAGSGTTRISQVSHS